MAKDMQLSAIRQGQISLADQCKLIDALYREALEYARLSMLKAKEAGEGLMAMKDSCKHGQFEKEIEDHCDYMSVDKARQCMRIVTHWDELLEKHGAVLYSMSVSAGLDSIKKLEAPKKPKKQEPQKDPVDGTDECPHGGKHTYDEEACTRCHDPRPPKRGQQAVPANDSHTDDDLPDQGTELAEEPATTVSIQQLGKLFLKTEKAFGELTNCLDELHQAHPWEEVAGMQDALGIIYNSFTRWKKEDS